MTKEQFEQLIETLSSLKGTITRSGSSMDISTFVDDVAVIKVEIIKIRKLLEGRP